MRFSLLHNCDPGHDAVCNHSGDSNGNSKYQNWLLLSEVLNSQFQKWRAIPGGSQCLIGLCSNIVQAKLWLETVFHQKANLTHPRQFAKSHRIQQIVSQKETFSKSPNVFIFHFVTTFQSDCTKTKGKDISRTKWNFSIPFFMFQFNQWIEKSVIHLAVHSCSDVEQASVILAVAIATTWNTMSEPFKRTPDS